jgi:hypothetical protein
MSPLPAPPAPSGRRPPVPMPAGSNAGSPAAPNHTNYYCICGYNCTTARALFKHIQRWEPGEPGRHVRAFGPPERSPGLPASRRDERGAAFPPGSAAAGR